MRKREYSIKVSNGSTDEKRVKDYLKMMKIDYDVRNGVFTSSFIRFKVDKKTWKVIKNDLDLAIESVYCTFKSLVKNDEETGA